MKKLICVPLGLAVFGILALWGDRAQATPAPTVEFCAQCLAVIVDGRALQTCPDGFQDGGNHCEILGAVCRPVGECTL